MNYRILRFFSPLLIALGLARGAAHLLEMSVKLGYYPNSISRSLAHCYGL